MIRKGVHRIYESLGMVTNNLRLLYWRIRDYVIKPQADAILFVAHPDDETLFFYSFIQEFHPYIVLLSDGWSIRRMNDFSRVMKLYDVKYRAYNLHSRDTRENLIKKYVEESMNIKKFNVCVTHNETGEYGHEMHKRVHDAVRKSVNCRMLEPINWEQIRKYPLDKSVCTAKTNIFKKYYKSEIFVLDMYTEWVENEKLVEVDLG